MITSVKIHIFLQEDTKYVYINYTKDNDIPSLRNAQFLFSISIVYLE